ncbi:hypothetical protein AMTRI_Chr13g84370 [Amborella trichopoda]
MPASNFRSSVRLKYVKLGYQYLVNHLLSFLLVPIMAAAAIELLRTSPEEILRQCHSLQLGLVQILCSSLFITVALSTILKHFRHMPFLDPKSTEFRLRILEGSGLGEMTCVPPALHYIPPDPSMANARAEAELVIFSEIDALFKRTGVQPKDIDILIVNCSQASTSGMGCTASPIAIDLARDLLQVHANAYAVVVSMEIIIPNWYTGNQQSMLLPNCLFRMGGAALLLSNRRSDSHRTKYGADDRAYRCIFQEEGAQGIVCVSDLVVIAASEQLLFLVSLIARKIFKLKLKPYIPDFKKAFEHFCIPAGGRAVIDEMEKNLQLSPEHVEASRMTLHRFGNASSSSLWYERSYIEAKGSMKKGDRVWQIAFGSGFKCNSAVWKCNRSIKAEADGPWADCIDQYPMHIPEVVKLQQF